MMPTKRASDQKNRCCQMCGPQRDRVRHAGRRQAAPCLGFQCAVQRSRIEFPPLNKDEGAQDVGAIALPRAREAADHLPRRAVAIHRVEQDVARGPRA